MKTKTLKSMVMGLAISLLLFAPAHAADKKGPTDEEMKAQMAKAKEGGGRGGSRSWMKPGDKPQQSSGTSSMAWVLGGRFLQQNFKGTWADQPFEGLGSLGYDKVKKEYVSVWMDSMSTALFQGAGQYDPATKTLSETGTFSCPVTGD